MQVGKSNIYELFNGTKQYVSPSKHFLAFKIDK